MMVGRVKICNFVDGLITLHYLLQHFLSVQDVMNTIWIVLPILTLLMFELGLTLEVKDFKLFRQRPWPVLAGLIGQIVR